MRRVRRSKPEDTRVRRKPRAGEGFVIRDIRPRKARDGDPEIAITVRVSSIVVNGEIDEEEFLDFLRIGIANYHTSRAGWVGFEMSAGITRPVLELVNEEEE